MNRWAEALEQEARRLAIMRAVPFTEAARRIREAVRLGVSTRHEAALVLTAVGLGDDVVRVLGEEPSVADDVQAGGPGLTFEEAARRYPEAFERALDTVAGRADEIAARFDAADPKWHWLRAALKRRYPKGTAQSIPDAGIIGPSKVGGTYAEQLGAPKGCLCTWMTHPTATGAALAERGAGPMSCPVHAKAPRYIGEFGNIDEPSMGDVHGYGRRG